MNILDNVIGSPVRSQRVYCGPTLGWIDAPIFQDKVITNPATQVYKVEPYDSVLLLTLSQVLTIFLPPSKRWYNKEYGSWSLYIKDIAGNFVAGSIQVTIVVDAEGGPPETIDGLAGYTMITPFSSIMLRPRSSLNGWYSL